MKSLLDEFLNFRDEVLVRRTKFQLARAEKYLEILLGLQAAIEHIDEVIKIIRGAKDTQIAAAELKVLLSITDDQVKAILDMKLSKLTGLEREKLLADIKSTEQKIKELKKLLDDRIYRWGKIKEDLIRIKSKYGDKRKTEIIDEEGKIETEDLIADKPVIVSMTKEGYIKIMPESTFKVQNRGGKGIIGQPSNENDVLLNIFTATTKSKVLFFTNKGKVYSLKVYEIPESRRESKGTSIYRLLRLDSTEFVTAAIPLVANTKIKYLLFVIIFALLLDEIPIFFCFIIFLKSSISRKKKH
jgi:DNA gyrase subunit A